MIELMIRMLAIADTETIKADKDFKILSGIYKIPETIGEVKKQIKIK